MNTVVVLQLSEEEMVTENGAEKSRTETTGRTKNQQVDWLCKPLWIKRRWEIAHKCSQQLLLMRRPQDSRQYI